MQNTCEVKVGRLMEIRIVAGFSTPADVDAQIARVMASMARVPPDARVVIAADWRDVPIMPAPAAQQAHKLLTTTSDRIERSGILASPASPTTLMQFFRLVAEAEHPSRRVLTSVADVEAWLAPLLTVPELRRLREFWAER